MTVSDLLPRLDSLIHQLQLLRADVSAAAPKLPPEAEQLLASGKCLSCRLDLGDARVIRGCHESCQKAIKRSIRAGELTEDQVIIRGLMTPRKDGGRPRILRPRLDEITAEIIAEGDKRTEAAKEKLAKKKSGSSKTKRRP